MIVEYLSEPLLIFGEGTNICPREGIASYKVYDTVQAARKTQLLIGVVGIEEDVEKIFNWLKRFENFIPANIEGKQKGLYHSFPGFEVSQGFCAKLIYDTNYIRIISRNEIKQIFGESNREKQVLKAVDVFYEHIKFLSDIKNCDVIISVVPKSFEGKLVIEKRDDEDVEETSETTSETDLETNFRRALKAKAMQCNTPIQLIREYVLHDTIRSQDAATKAWNLCTALYYKALQT